MSLLKPPRRFVQSLQPLALQVPGAEKGSWQLAKHEAIDAFAQLRRGGVFRRRHMAVMAAIVFNRKVAIAHQRGLNQTQFAR